MREIKNNAYVCVNCGSCVKSLYKQYGPSVLKLSNCVSTLYIWHCIQKVIYSKFYFLIFFLGSILCYYTKRTSYWFNKPEYCGNVSDKYIEYDIIIIFIDLILFSKEAYRHILFNVQYKNYFKLALLQLIVISFDEGIYSQISINLRESEGFYESTLYLLTLGIILGKILFFSIIYFSINFHNKYIVNKPLTKSNIIKVWEAIVCSSFGYFLLLTILIWDDFQREVHMIFITTYVNLSQIQALSVATDVPRTMLGVICTFATLVDCLFTNFFKWSFGIQNEILEAVTLDDGKLKFLLKLKLTTTTSFSPP